MSVATSEAESRVVLYGVSWSTFEALSAENEAHGTRFTYDRGFLEITSPSYKHERIRKLLGRMVGTATLELNIPVLSAGSTTLKAESKQRGLDPDECYFVGNEQRMRGRKEYDAAVDPPPDLVIEVDISRSSLNKLAIYADFGVPEVWVHDGVTLRVYQLQSEGGYVQQERSVSFPFLVAAEIQRFLDDRNTTDETTWIRSFRDWVRGLKGS